MLLQRTVINLMNALNNYYYIECVGNHLMTNQDIKNQLQEMGLLNNQPLMNPWGGLDHLSAQVLEDDNRSHLLQVSVDLTLDNQDDYMASLASWIRGTLGGDELQNIKDKNKITWTQKPFYSRDNINSLEWADKNQKPVTLTPMYAGLNSNLWMLNRNLQAFTKQNENQTNGQSSCDN